MNQIALRVALGSGQVKALRFNPDMSIEEVEQSIIGKKAHTRIFPAANFNQIPRFSFSFSLLALFAETTETTQKKGEKNPKKIPQKSLL